MEKQSRTRSRFTDSDLEVLNASQYVLSASPTTVNFTEEFKEQFYKRFTEGERPADIFESCGLSVELLGVGRINGFVQNLKRKMDTDGFVADKRALNGPRASKVAEDDPNAMIKHLQAELNYLKGEVELLKKTRMADLEAQKLWESRHRRR